MSWVMADIYCKNLYEGATLAEIHNIETQNLLSSKLNGKGTFWLGATDSKSVIFKHFHQFLVIWIFQQLFTF